MKETMRAAFSGFLPGADGQAPALFEQSKAWEAEI